jgi:UDP-N-acetylglucosamine 4-epimerase
VAVGAKTSLLELYAMIRARLATRRPELASLEPVFQPFRPGDIKDSQADITKARTLLGYAPTHTVSQGMDETVTYALENAA